jgi:LmbE family N-acetylglucosaminyl deacetylase
MPYWLLIAGLLLLLAAIGSWMVGELIGAGRIWKEGARDVLILAAHQDDCAIMAGEYAIRATSVGRRVEVVYLTCGDQAVATERSLNRCKEASVAWGGLGVGGERLHFLNLPASAPTGPSLITAEQLTKVEQELLQILKRWPANGVMFVPAEVESHVDHRTLREVALKAMQFCGRNDITVLETPEYNPYFSLLRCPRKAMQYACGVVPLFGKITMQRGAKGASGFVAGDFGWTLPADPQRLARKLAMLRSFVSEDGELLVRLFGRPDYFRPMRDAGAAGAVTPFYVSIHGAKIGLSVLSLLGGFYLVSLACAWLAVRAFHPFGYAFAMALLLICLGLCVRRQCRIERRALYAAVAAGAAIAMCGF